MLMIHGKNIGDLQTQFKTAVDTEKWMSHGVDLGYTKPDEVQHAHQFVLNLEEEIKRLQQTVNDLGLCPLTNCSRHSNAKVNNKTKRRATASDNFSVPPKRHTAKILVNDKLKEVRLENKFSNLKVDKAVAGEEQGTPTEPKMPPIMRTAATAEAKPVPKCIYPQ
ncbi:hypothetical protein CEXT_676841 [Caerostris extrusa]|uniref:Uncharacterized protein n=1 Tax=Caerostris extrusa TaxID=172846 RepID=A0AAV4UI68_CAEEX|nr:hypothetical protein CEXT_676841 [Caerostris extrusa]